ncbi:MAG: tetratricopeptide repeat protein [Planctomycetes bacterium]|nr:tetratricopeptide repeat protein [Planctomycetota bacterium]
MKKPATTTANAASPPGPLIVCLLLVAVATTFVFWPAISAKAVMFDDDQYLTDNPYVQAPSFRSAWIFLSEILRPSTVGGYYQPLAMISLMLDCAMGGTPEDQSIFHVTSLALHVMNTVLVGVLIFLMFRQVAPAALVSLLFGMHPMHVESVAWLSERKSVLAAFFALAGLIAYFQYTRSEEAPSPNHQHRIRRYAICLVLFVLALLSKPTTTPLPVAMLLMDVWPLKRFSRRAVIEKIPLFALAAVSAVITILSQRNTADITRPEDYPPAAVPLILCHNIVFYLRKLVWPSALSGFYPFPGAFSLSTPAYLIGVIGTLALVVLLIASLRWTTSILIGWLIFFVMIFPTLGVIGFTAVIAADRFVYLPMIGLLLPLAGWMSMRWRGGIEGRRRAMAGVALLASVAMAIGTRNYLALWQDNEQFTRHMLRDAPNAASLRVAMGHIELKKGRVAEAAEEFKAAVDAESSFLGAKLNLVSALTKLGRAAEAEPLARKAVEMKPGAPETHTYLAMCLEAQNRLQEAVQEHEKALALRAFDAKTHYNLATALAKSGRTEDAIRHFTDALRIQPNHPRAMQNLAMTYFQSGRLDEAMAWFARALQAAPTMTQAAYQLGCARMAAGRTTDAIASWREALRIDPGFLEALTDLAWVLATTNDNAMRNGAEALQLAERADQLSGGNIGVVLDALAASQAETGAYTAAVATQRRAIEAERMTASPRLGGLRRPTSEMENRLKHYESSQPFRASPDRASYMPNVQR